MIQSLFRSAAIVAAALLAARALQRWLPLHNAEARNAAVDGLRGFMALGVYIYHTVVWEHYLQGGVWQTPTAASYRHLGDSCVKVFFMITSYLFIGKIIDSKAAALDWRALYIGRVLRLAPLYVLAVAAISLMAGMLAGWQLHEPVCTVALELIDWLAFTVRASPDINGLPETSLLIAGVTWTLAYEWIFYLSLPLIAFVLRRRVSFVAIFCASAMFLLLVSIKSYAFLPAAFAGGAAAAVIARSNQAVSYARSVAASILTLISAALATLAPGTLPGGVRTILLAVAFVAVACGNTLFGLLSNQPARVLGELSYGVYLLHGLLLALAFRFVLGIEAARTLNSFEYALMIIALAIALVALAAATFRLVELPAMNLARRFRRARPPLALTAERAGH